MSGPDNYSKIVLRTFHVTPTTIVLRPMPSPHHSHNLWPTVAQVQSGVVFGEGQNQQVEYETGTFSGSGGGTKIYTFVG